MPYKTAIPVKVGCVAWREQAVADLAAILDLLEAAWCEAQLRAEIIRPLTEVAGRPHRNP